MKGMLVFVLAMGLFWVGCATTPPTPECPVDVKAEEVVGEETVKKESPSKLGYDGHGAASVPPEVLAQYAAPRLESTVSRRIQAMMDISSPSPGIISPDGKTLVFNWSVTGTPQVWRLTKPMGFPEQLTGGEDSTYAQEILPNGKQIVISRDRKGEENPGLYLQPIGGGALTLIQHKDGSRTFFEWVSPDSKFIYYRSNDIKENAYAIYRYDIAAKKKELVFDEDGLWTIADVHKDGRILLQKYKGNLYSELFELDVKTKKLTPLLGQDEMEEYEVMYGALQGEILVLTNKFGEYRRLYSYKDAGFTPITDEIKYDVAWFDMDRAGKRILYEVNQGGYIKLFPLNAKTKKTVKHPKIPPADHVYGSNSSYNGRFSVVAIDDGKKPRASFVIDWQRKKLTAWHEPSTPEIDTSGFVRAELEHYPAEDGTKIPVWVRMGEGCEKKLCPVIVHFHGGPEGQTRPGFSWSSQLFVDAGFVYVSPNVRGSDGYGKTWLHADNGPKRKDVISDIRDAATWAKKRFAKGGKEPKLGVYGGSYGGYSVLVGMTIYAGHYDVGVQIVGISNLVTFLENTAPYRRILRATEYGDPVKDREVLLELSPTTHIDKLKGPILHIQGATDPRVPVGEAIQIHQGLVDRGVESDLIIFPDEGHGCRKRPNRVLMYGHAVKFFEEHLLGE